MHSIARFCCLLAFVCCPVVVAADDLKFWTDTTGKYSVKAEFVKLDGDKVVLKRDDGKVVEIPLEKLNKVSQNQARIASEKAGQPAAESSKSVPKPVREEDQSAPREPISSGPTPVVPFRDDATINEFMDVIVDQLQQFNTLVLWDALPASYQSDINDLAKLVGTKVDGQIFKQYNQLVSRIVRIARSKKQYVMNSRHLVSQIGDPAMIAPFYDEAVGVIEAYLGVGLITDTELKKGNVRPILDTYSRNVMTKVRDLGDKLPPGNPLSQQLMNPSVVYRVVSQSGRNAVIEISSANSEGQPTSIELVAAAGRWLPAKMVEEWDSTMAQARASLNSLTPKDMNAMKMQVGLVTSSVSGMLLPLENASSQDEFDSAIDELIRMIQSLVPGGGAGLGPGGGFGPGGF